VQSNGNRRLGAEHGLVRALGKFVESLVSFSKSKEV
jgi:hypothetical protein